MPILFQCCVHDGTACPRCNTIKRFVSFTTNFWLAFGHKDEENCVSWFEILTWKKNPLVHVLAADSC